MTLEFGRKKRWMDWFWLQDGLRKDGCKLLKIWAVGDGRFAELGIAGHMDPCRLVLHWFRPVV